MRLGELAAAAAEVPDEEPKDGNKGDEGKKAKDGKESDGPVWEGLVRGGALEVAVARGGCRGDGRG